MWCIEVRPWYLGYCYRHHLFARMAPQLSPPRRSGGARGRGHHWRQSARARQAHPPPARHPNIPIYPTPSNTPSFLSKSWQFEKSEVATSNKYFHIPIYIKGCRCCIVWLVFISGNVADIKSKGCFFWPPLVFGQELKYLVYAINYGSICSQYVLPLPTPRWLWATTLLLS